MENNTSAKNMIILLGVILILVLIFWLVVGWVVIVHDKKENKYSAKYFYTEQIKKYDTSKEFSAMNYAYNSQTNIGYVSGGGFTKDGCFEEYIVDAWSNEEIASVSICPNEKITKEKLDAVSNFWKEHSDIFTNK